MLARTRSITDRSLTNSASASSRTGSGTAGFRFRSASRSRWTSTTSCGRVPPQRPRRPERLLRRVDDRPPELRQQLERRLLDHRHLVERIRHQTPAFSTTASRSRSDTSIWPVTSFGRSRSRIARAEPVAQRSSKSSRRASHCSRTSRQRSACNGSALTSPAQLTSTGHRAVRDTPCAISLQSRTYPASVGKPLRCRVEARAHETRRR